VVYPPGAGGNHLKNLLCLSGEFVNSHELDPAVYDAQDRPPGEVWCVGGRNLQPAFFDRISQSPKTGSVLTAHFGELAQHRSRIAMIPRKRLVIITIDCESARRRLEQRQTRLGQNIHPYWLDEELVWCYQTEIYMRYHGVAAEHCLEIPMLDFWRSDLIESDTLPRIESFLDISIPRQPAKTLHDKWCHSNFGSGIG